MVDLEEAVTMAEGTWAVVISDFRLEASLDSASFILFSFVPSHTNTCNHQARKFTGM